MASSRTTLISDAPLSESSAATKSRARAIYEEMRVSTPELMAAYPCAFERLPESTICSREFFHVWGTFLTDYRSSSARSETGHLAPGTALGYFGALMQIAGGLYAQKGSPESKEFLTCLLPKSQTAPLPPPPRRRLRQVCTTTDIVFTAAAVAASTTIAVALATNATLIAIATDARTVVKEHSPRAVRLAPPSCRGRRACPPHRRRRPLR